MQKGEIVAEALVENFFGDEYSRESRRKLGGVLLKAGSSWLQIYDIAKKSRVRIGYANSEIEDLVQCGLVETKLLQVKDGYKSRHFRHYKLKENYRKQLEKFLEKTN